MYNVVMYKKFFQIFLFYLKCFAICPASNGGKKKPMTSTELQVEINRKT